MKVEQRIGRIDRLGQIRPKVRILNFAYKDTVEADVFFAVGERIQLFQGIVGRLQPILSKLPRRFEELTLASREGRESARQRFLAEIEEEVDQAAEAPLDLDAVGLDGSAALEAPTLPEPPYNLESLDAAMAVEATRPQDLEWSPKDRCTYGARLPGMDTESRVTTSASVFEDSGDSHQFFSPGGPLYQALMARLDGDCPEAAQPGVCWLLRDDTGHPAGFVVNTEAGFLRVERLNDLLMALGRVREPLDFPAADWPGYRAFTIA
jgi:hypothetical protein